MSARIRRWLRALRPGWNDASSSTAPTRALGRSSSSYGTPPNVAEPDEGRIRPSSARMVVLLPAPFGPRKPVTRPASMPKERCSTAATPPKCLDRSWNSTGRLIWVAPLGVWNMSRRVCAGACQASSSQGPLRGHPKCRFSGRVPLSNDRDACSGSGCDQSALVRQNHGLDPVAQPELRQKARDVGLDRALGYEQLSGQLRVALAACEQLQHLELAMGQRLQARAELRVRPRMRELLDDAPRDRRREQRVAVRHDPDRVHQLLGRRVLDQEATGTGLERLEHVLV